MKIIRAEVIKPNCEHDGDVTHGFIDMSMAHLFINGSYVLYLSNQFRIIREIEISFDEITNLLELKSNNESGDSGKLDDFFNQELSEINIKFK